MVAALILLSGVLLGGSVQADSLTYDASGTHPNAPVGGSNYWSGSTNNPVWSNVQVVPPGTATDVSWDNAANNTAVFDNYRSAGTSTVTIAGGPVSAKGIVFSNTLGNASIGYLITDGGISSNTLTLSDATPTITAYANATIQAGINTVTGLTKNGTGSLTLSSLFNPQYSGTTTINGGVLNITSNSSIGTGNVVVNGSGALEISGQSLMLDSAAGKTFTAGGGSLILNNSPMVGVQSFTRTAGGGLVIVPNNSTALGTTEKLTVSTPMTLVNGIVDASFVARNSAADSTADFLTYGVNGLTRATYSTATAITNGVSGGTSAASVFHATTTTNNTVSSATTLYGLKVDANVAVNGSFTLGDGTHTAGLILNSNSAVPRNTINGSVFFKTGSEGAIYVGGNPASGVAYALITGSVVGSNGMTKSGVGTLELANAQYTGATTINQGTVIFDSAANSGLNSGTRQTSVINLAGTALYAFTGGGVRATVNLAGDGSIGSADGFSLPFFGTVNGNGHELNITNTQTYGAVLFNGTANNVSQFNVNYGVLQIGASLGTTNAPIVVTDGANSATSELVITAGAFVANDIVLNQGSLGGGGNSGTSTITGSLTLTNAGGNVVTQGGSLVLAGSIRGSSPLLFQSTGGGVTISGSANTYTGSTEVSSGRLTVTGSIASSSSVQVGAGVPSTAILTGNGAASQVNLEGGGKLAPGISGAGTFTATGLKWDSDGTGQLQFNLGGTPAASSELSLGTGAFTKGAGSNFVFDFLNSGVAGQDYTLVTFGAGNTNFSLNDFMASDLAAGLNGTFSLSINGNVESLDFAVVEAPEPGTMALLVPGLIGLLLIAGWRRGQPARIAGE